MDKNDAPAPPGPLSADGFIRRVAGRIDRDDRTITELMGYVTDVCRIVTDSNDRELMEAVLERSEALLRRLHELEDEARAA